MYNAGDTIEVKAKKKNQCLQCTGSDSYYYHYDHHDTKTHDHNHCDQLKNKLSHKIKK